MGITLTNCYDKNKEEIENDENNKKTKKKKTKRYIDNK